MKATKPSVLHSSRPRKRRTPEACQQDGAGSGSKTTRGIEPSPSKKGGFELENRSSPWDSGKQVGHKI